MTLIIGLIDNENKTWLACDSIASDGFTFHIQKQPKVFAKRDTQMGYTDSFRLGQLLEHDLSLPARTTDQTDPLAYLVGGVVPALRDCLTSGGYARNHQGEEQGGNFPIGLEGRLFELQRDYSVLERAEPYAAVGSGEYHALAALHMARALNLDPERTLRLAFEAVVANVVTVRGPFWVLRPGADAPELLSPADSPSSEGAK